MKVVWSEQALARLIEIQDFVAQSNPNAAAALVARIAERGDGLAQFPEMGRAVPELSGSDLRELIEGRYRIVYRVRGKRIEILTVFEGHRQFPANDLAG
jgi:toxin ParE1/3/4